MGLVVGSVQSGKTANYTGLICKAADAGFNMIIVLAGIHSNSGLKPNLELMKGFWVSIQSLIEENTKLVWVK